MYPLSKLKRPSEILLMIFVISGIQFIQNIRAENETCTKFNYRDFSNKSIGKKFQYHDSGNFVRSVRKIQQPELVTRQNLISERFKDNSRMFRELELRREIRNTPSRVPTTRRFIGEKERRERLATSRIREERVDSRKNQKFLRRNTAENREEQRQRWADKTKSRSDFNAMDAGTMLEITLRRSQDETLREQRQNRESSRYRFPDETQRENRLYSREIRENRDSSRGNAQKTVERRQRERSYPDESRNEVEDFNSRDARRMLGPSMRRIQGTTLRKLKENREFPRSRSYLEKQRRVSHESYQGINSRKNVPIRGVEKRQRLALDESRTDSNLIDARRMREPPLRRIQLGELREKRYISQSEEPRMSQSRIDERRVFPKPQQRRNLEQNSNTKNIENARRNVRTNIDSRENSRERRSSLEFREHSRLPTMRVVDLRKTRSDVTRQKKSIDESRKFSRNGVILEMQRKGLEKSENVRASLERNEFREKSRFTNERSRKTIQDLKRFRSDLIRQKTNIEMRNSDELGRINTSPLEISKNGNNFSFCFGTIQIALAVLVFGQLFFLNNEKNKMRVFSTKYFEKLKSF